MPRAISPQSQVYRRSRKSKKLAEWNRLSSMLKRQGARRQELALMRLLFRSFVFSVPAGFIMRELYGYNLLAPYDRLEYKRLQVAISRLNRMLSGTGYAIRSHIHKKRAIGYGLVPVGYAKPLHC